MSNELELNKDRADADRYYKLFADKVGKIEDGERILFIHIGNFDVLDKFIQSNHNCSYFIIDQHLNGSWFKMSWGCKFIGTNEDNSIVKALEKLNMKFDKIIMNPPYNKNLHLNILKEAIQHLTKDGICVNLSPTRWLEDPLINFGLAKEFNEFENGICKHLEGIETIEAEKANQIFNIAHTDLGIYVCKLSETKFDYKQLSKIDATLKSLLSKLNVQNPYYRNKIFSVTDNSIPLEQFVDKYISKLDKQNRHFILLNRANGNKNATWQSNVISKYGVLDRATLKKALIDNPGVKMVMQFKDAEKKNAEQLLKFLKFDCLRFGLAITQETQNMLQKCYTFFPDVDYSQFKNEQDFYKYFGITEDEQKLIEKTMEKYK